VGIRGTGLKWEQGIRVGTGDQGWGWNRGSGIGLEQGIRDRIRTGIGLEQRIRDRVGTGGQG